MHGEGERRRRVLLALGCGAGALTGGFGIVAASDAADHPGLDTELREARSADCSPGHEDGDTACRQIFDDRKSLTPFDAADTPLPVRLDYPCGWTASLTEFEDRIQLNATRSGIGEANAYVDVQVRAYYEPVEEGLIEDIRSDGDYEAVEYTFAGESRTGVVSSQDSAQFGTTGHAAIPVGQQFAHVEFVSTLKGTNCTLEPRPDWWVVHDMLATIGANPESRFREVAPEFTPPASVSASDQRVADSSYPDFVVDSVDLPEGGFAVVKRAGDGSIIGASAKMTSGEHQNIRITLNEALPTGGHGADRDSVSGHERRHSVRAGHRHAVHGRRGAGIRTGDGDGAGRHHRPDRDAGRDAHTATGDDPDRYPDADSTGDPFHDDHGTNGDEWGRGPGDGPADCACGPYRDGLSRPQGRD